MRRVACVKRSGASAAPEARRGGAGATEEVALAEAGLQLAQRGELLGGLDALGDDLEVERAGEVDDHADEARFAPAGGQAVDERLGDLQRVQRQRMQVRQRRVACAEVVEGDLHAELAQLVEALY